MEKTKDPSYDLFVSKKEVRYPAYKQKRSELMSQAQELKAQYKHDRSALLAQKAEKIHEGMSKKQAKAYIGPSLVILKDRYASKKKELAMEGKTNRMVIFPFRLFYKPIAYNGSYLLKPQGASFVAFLIILAIFVFSLFFIEPEKAVFNPDQISAILSQLFGPQGGMSSIHTWGQWWAYMGTTAIPLIWETFMMMFVATVLGCILAIPFMILCSTNIIKNKGVTGASHVLLNIVRTFPTVVLAIIGVACFGISNLAGIFAMIIFTAGIMIKIMFEFIETVDMHPYEASISTGASKPQAFVVAIVPQIIPAFLSNALYTFEINIRASVVLGFVGAGGIGLEISNSMGLYKYNQIGAILLPLFILVVALQLLSNYVKKRTM